jgi:hypothetical protein
MKSLVAGIALFAASVALAGTAPPVSRGQLTQDPGVGSGTRVAELPKDLVAKPGMEIPAPTGLAFDLPAEAVKPSGKLTVTVLNGVRIYVEETIELPAAFNEAPTIAFLANHPGELERVRKAANARPQAIRFTVALDGKVLVNVPFVEADGGSERLAYGGKVVGQSRSVTVNLRDPLKVALQGMVPDPACQADCDQAFYDCYTYCDERGAGCPWCQTQYSDCLAACPQVCVEPKDVHYVWSAWVYTGSYNNGNICISNYYAYILWTDFFQRAKYQRTVHCDDTYTDVFQNYEYDSSYCKQYLGPGCFGNFYNPPPNC